MTIKNIKRVRTLCQGNNPVQSVSIDEALRDLLTFITQVKTSDQHNHLTAFIGHNYATFAVLILLRNSDKNFKDSITDMNVYFADSLHLVKKPDIQDKYETLKVDTGEYCNPNQGSL